MTKKRLICTVHDEIDELCDELDSLDVCEKLKKKIEKISAKIRKDAAEAKEYGQSMEARLYEYKGAVDSIGFTRKKK